MTGKGIKIITDGNCLGKDIYDKEGISHIDSYIDIEGKLTKEQEMNREEFIAFLDVADPYPKTALASPQDAFEAFRKADEDGFDEILYLALHSTVSNQFNSVKLGAKKYEKEGGKAKVTLYITGHMTTPQGVMAYNAAQLVKQGKTVEEIVSYLDSIKEQIYTAGFATSFEGLWKTGKIGKDVKITVISKLLRLKPLTEIIFEKGPVGMGGARGFKAATQKTVENLKKKTDPDKFYDLFVADALVPKYKKILLETIPKSIKIKNKFDWEIQVIPTWAFGGRGSVIATIAPALEE